MEKCKPASQEFNEIKKQLAEVKSDLKRYVEQYEPAIRRAAARDLA